MPKMVMNNFGNRNLMQPMGRLSMHSKCLDFFSFKFWVGVVGGVGEGFFSFFLCSNMFLLSSWHAPKSLVRPTWGFKYVELRKVGTWGPLSTSSTKGGKRGMLEVSGLD